MSDKKYRGDAKLYDVLEKEEIPFEYYEHPAVPTIEDVVKYKKGIASTFCKNLFFRNHKGNRHYLVILEHLSQLNIKDLERRLKQGKISLASPIRLEKYLGLQGGSVSPFGLIHDNDNHVHIFIDENLQHVEKLSFHPNLNTASLVIKNEDFLKFLDCMGNSYEFIKLYD